jgi:hyperosmotically inducible protein
VNLNEQHDPRKFEDAGMRMIHWALVFLLLFAVSSFTASSEAAPRPHQAAKDQRAGRVEQNLVREVRHQLVLLPYYSVFDNLAFKVEGDHVILGGQVTRPTLKSDAENVVKSIEGVASVTNNIEVLPPSPMDDQLRRALYRAINGDPSLSKYAWSAVPSIHVIVKNGNVTLEGVVDSETDKNLAGLRANSVPNVFSVKNNLVVAANAK